jgi:hypothetical protein
MFMIELRDSEGAQRGPMIRICIFAAHCRRSRGRRACRQTMCDMIPNAEHWRVSVWEAQELQHAIMGYEPRATAAGERSNASALSPPAVQFLAPETGPWAHGEARSSDRGMPFRRRTRLPTTETVVGRAAVKHVDVDPVGVGRQAQVDGGARAGMLAGVGQGLLHDAIGGQLHAEVQPIGSAGSRSLQQPTSQRSDLMLMATAGSLRCLVPPKSMSSPAASLCVVPARCRR